MKTFYQSNLMRFYVSYKTKFSYTMSVDKVKSESIK